MAQERISKTVLLDGAQMALAAYLAATMGFLKERGIDIKDWVGYIGEAFADMLGAMEGAGADEIMEHLLALEFRPMGVEVLSSQLSADKAGVKLTSLPSKNVLEKFGTTPEELLEGFGVTQREFAAIYGIFDAAAEAIGFNFTHELRGGKQLLSLEPAAGKKKRAK